jgi:hypothetical protein
LTFTVMAMRKRLQQMLDLMRWKFTKYQDCL